jgi:PST family polysaccharide transporter
MVTSKVKQVLVGLKNGKSLGKRSIRGAMWIGLAEGADNLLRLARNVILARILAPSDFGAMALVLAVCMAFETVSEVGMREAIIQYEKAEDSRYLNGAWWLSTLRGTVLYIMAFVTSPLIGRFYERTDLVLMMKVIFLSLVLNGLMSPRLNIAIKKMDFHKWAAVRNGSGFLGLTTAIILALVYRNVWALVIGYVVEMFIRTLLSYILCPFMPRWKFEKEHLGALLKFARGMAGVPIMTFIFLRADIFVAGKLLPLAAVGMYSLAVSLSKAPFRLIWSISNRISMPVFSELQNQPERLNKSILQVVRMINLLGWPMTIFAVFFSAEILELVYGEKYIVVAVPFALLVIAEQIRISSVPMVSAYLAMGRPDLNRIFTAARAVIMIIIIVPFIKWMGLTGAALSGITAMSLSYILQLNRAKSLIGLNPLKYLSNFIPAFVCIATIGPFWFVSNTMVKAESVLGLAIGGAGCMITYGILLMSVHKEFMSVITEKGALQEN